MNNKGQTLVVFVILLPFVCILAAYIFDKCYLLYQKKELSNVASIICEYALNDEKTEDEIKQLALENDKDIENIKIIRDEEVEIILEKKQKSMFSGLVGLDSYQLKAEISCVE